MSAASVSKREREDDKGIGSWSGSISSISMSGPQTFTHTSALSHKPRHIPAALWREKGKTGQALKVNEPLHCSYSINHVSVKTNTIKVNIQWFLDLQFST